MADKQKILVVDDSQAILTYARAVLESGGYEVVTSNNPISVAALVRREAPDMILMDIQMPAISGTDVVATLQRFGCSDGVRVVLFSASITQDDLARRSESVGAHGFIHKASPLEPTRLLEQVRELFAAPIRPPARLGALVVDDSRTVRLFLSQVLRDQGYEVVSAAHGREALEKLELHKPDLALVDLEMPEMDGLELVMAMQSDPNYQGIPILLVTSVKDSDRIAAVMEAGASDCVSKPLSTGDLVQRLRSLGA